MGGKGSGRPPGIAGIIAQQVQKPTPIGSSIELPNYSGLKTTAIKGNPNVTETDPYAVLATGTRDGATSQAQTFTTGVKATNYNDIPRTDLNLAITNTSVIFPQNKINVSIAKPNISTGDGRDGGSINIISGEGGDSSEGSRGFGGDINIRTKTGYSGGNITIRAEQGSDSEDGFIKLNVGDSDVVSITSSGTKKIAITDTEIDLSCNDLFINTLQGKSTTINYQKTLTTTGTLTFTNGILTSFT